MTSHQLNLIEIATLLVNCKCTTVVLVNYYCQKYMSVFIEHWRFISQCYC